MSDYTTLFKAWLDDVKRRDKTAETESEIKDIEQCLKRITIQKLKNDIATQQHDNESLEKRLKDTRQNDDDSETSISEKYRINRTRDRNRALNARNDPTFLNNKLKEIFNFCLRSAIQQLTDLKKILHPEGQAGKSKSTTTADVKELHELKSDNPNIAQLQHLTTSQSRANLRNTFYSEHSEHQSDPKEIKEYFDSCLDLCWDMCTSDPVIYFIWEEDKDKNKYLFYIDESDGKGNLEVVWPALVQISDRGYNKLVEGLKQRKGDKENSNTNIDNITTLKQDSSATVSTTETTVHVPGSDASKSDTITTKDKKKDVLKKTYDKEKRGNPSKPSSRQKPGEHVTKISVENPIVNTKGASKPNPSVRQNGAHNSANKNLNF